MPLDKIEVIGEAGAGLVRLTYNGFNELTKVEIDDLIFKETDKQLISDLFVAASRQATKKLSEVAMEEMRHL